MYVYRCTKCTEYKTLNEFKSFIILNDLNEISKYGSLHNHFEKEFMYPEHNVIKFEHYNFNNKRCLLNNKIEFKT